MNQRDVKKLGLGLYRLHWTDGGSSLASVGMTFDGGRWMAPINWVRPSEDQRLWHKVLRVERIKTKEDKEL